MTPSQLICIVDDSADYRFIFQQLFSRSFLDYPVRLFASGSAFLDGLLDMSEKPGLVLLDRHMPGLDGYQTLLRLKQHSAYNQIPVVMMSADASESEIGVCYDAGANSFMPKSIDFNLVKETMIAVCDYWLKPERESTPQSHRTPVLPLGIRGRTGG